MTDNLLNQGGDPELFDENKDWLAELVGEGKKFKDSQALAKSKAFSDAHIKLVEKQNEEYRQMALQYKEQADAGAKLQDLLDKLEQKQLSSREEPINSNEMNTKPTLGIDEMESLISNKLAQHEQATREKENYSKVEAKLRERLGDNYKGILKNQAQALNLTDEDVNQLARKNPTLFFKTFDLNSQPKDGFQAPPPNSPGFVPKPTEKRTWSYYLKLKEKDPSAWLNKKIILQMESDSQALGREFYDV